MDEFAGDIVHPQELARPMSMISGKRIIVIGSGATAVTMAPALAQRAGHVTMLQRSPSYVVSMPARDDQVNRLRGRLPHALVSWLARWKMILFATNYYRKARANPREVRETCSARHSQGAGTGI